MYACNLFAETTKPKRGGGKKGAAKKKMVCLSKSGEEFWMIIKTKKHLSSHIVFTFRK